MDKRLTERNLRIAILGWGSLLWDKHSEFDRHHCDWQPDGPVLPLEFSHVSASRERALTLVIDPDHGTECQVAYAVSTRRCPEDAIADLRSREGTVMKRIEFLFANGNRRCEPDVPGAISPWARRKKFDVVVWTGLCSNFRKKTGKSFTVEAAIEHLQGLPTEGKAIAATYVWRALLFIRTQLRECLETQPWFSASHVERSGRDTWPFI